MLDITQVGGPALPACQVTRAASDYRAMLGLPPSIVIVPEPLAEPTQKLLDAYGALDGNTLPCSIVPLAPGKPPKYPPLVRYHAVMGELLTCHLWFNTSNALR